MQIFHLGLHKTGTTSLQRNLFSRSNIPYHGLHGPDWQTLREPWLEFFRGMGVAPLPRDGSFIYSYEATLLRCGGLAGASMVARQIARNFSTPAVLVTVREPSALLVSAYFQSLRLRRSALGFSNGKPAFRKPVRFMPFEEWWERLARERETSLAGLLDYNDLKSALGEWLQPHQILFLKLETLSARDQSYADRLSQLGFSQSALAGFLAAPPENTGSGKKLQKERLLLSRLGRQCDRLGIASPIGAMLRATGLIRPVEQLLYSGKAGGRSRIDTCLLEEIQAEFRPGFDLLD